MDALMCELLTEGRADNLGNDPSGTRRAVAGSVRPAERGQALGFGVKTAQRGQLRGLG